MDYIKIRGARVHNLKNIDLDIPKNKLVVITGISGSGKSSLAFDTIYAEGQRRYVESLSAYARQFLGLMDKPDVDKIEGLSPAISIDQKSASRNPRSTVGTITEIYDYLRLLFARVGHPHCPNCGQEISTMTVQAIVDAVLNPSGLITQQQRVLVLAPLVKDRKGEYSKLFDDLRRRGFIKVRVDGEVRSLEENFVLIKTNRHSIEVVVDKLVVQGSRFKIQSSKLEEKGQDQTRQRLTEAVETALKLSSGQVIISQVKDRAFEFPEFPRKMEDHLYSEQFACARCNLSLPDLEPRNFSFNSPHGACPSCHGLGNKLEVDPGRVFSPRLTINEGGILPWSNIGENSWMGGLIEALGKKHGFNLDTPLQELSDKQRNILLYGAGTETFLIDYTNQRGHTRRHETTYEGIIPHLTRRHKQTESDYMRAEIEKYMVEKECEECQGTRLRPESLAVTIVDMNIAAVSQMSIGRLQSWLIKMRSRLSRREAKIARLVLKELRDRVKFLLDVGLDYLTINRGAATLSGGEAQRIRLASQIGSGLCGVLYVLDEPSIGLHVRDQARLIKTLKDLRDLGNTVIVVEHDLQTILAADWVIDIGPGAGEHGGKVVAEGPPEKIKRVKKSLTGQYLAGAKKIEVGSGRWEGGNLKREVRGERPAGKRLAHFTSPSGEEDDTGYKSKEVVTRSQGFAYGRQIASSTTNSNQHRLTLFGASHHNLKSIDVSFPLGKFICVTGVSGSGKSTLVMDVLYRALALKFYHSRQVPGAYLGLEGIENLDKAVDIDQSPIGRTPRSNPATYTGIFTYIRDLFAQTPEARARGYKKGRFSFNVKGGRCENCRGEGELKVEMQFLPAVYITCEACGGTRFNRETLEIRYKGKNIAEVLGMTGEEALSFFTNIPPLKRKLKTIADVGLSYIKLGQPAPTLSGGEAQRVKLAAELSKKATGKTLYILDEPTTGLHFFDIEKLLVVLHRLAAAGNTVIVIEHNLDVIKTADWIIDLGPEGGEKGGRIVAEGRIDDIIKNKESYTGKYLKEYLDVQDQK